MSTNNSFAATGQLLRLILRVDRLKLSLWLIGIVVLIGITPTSIRSITEAEARTQGVSPEMILAQQSVLLESNGASIALQGPADALDTFGGRYAFEIGAFTFVIVGLMNVLLIGRHTRSEEESGRAELVRAAAVGPWSAIAAVSIVAVAANTIVAGVTTAVFAADGLEIGPSALFGVSLGLAGLVFAATALIFVQIFEYSRASTGASVGILGLAFGLRAVGDVNDNAVSLLSPIGWAQAVDAFGDRALWPLAILVMASISAVGISVALVVRRDVGAGLLSQRAGPAAAKSWLTSPMGMAWRLQRSMIGWWVVGVGFMGAVYGSVISAIDEFADQNEAMVDALEALGLERGELRLGFINITLSMMALIAGGGVLQSLLRPRQEESAGRVEPILAGSVARWSWLGSHLLLTLLAGVAFMVASGAALVVSDALVVGSFSDTAAVMAAAVARVPALLAIVGIGVVLYGWRSRASLGIWGVFGAIVITFFLGEVLRFPEWVKDLSPIRHVTNLPGSDQGWLSIAVLLSIGLAGVATGLALFERRDIG